jgi:acyl carrier protein
MDLSQQFFGEKFKDLWQRMVFVFPEVIFFDRIRPCSISLRRLLWLKQMIVCYGASRLFSDSVNEEIQAANIGLLTQMDSLAGVTLVAGLTKEFGVETDLEKLVELGTFPAIQQ